jgi:hypothetical protein
VDIVDVIEFKEKIQRRWGNSHEIKALLLLAGLWNRGLNDGWDGELNLDSDLLQLGIPLSLKKEKIFIYIFNKWIEAGLIREVSSDRFIAQHPGFASPVFFDI